MPTETREAHPREQRGFEIASRSDQIDRLDERTYRVRSQSKEGWYQVVRLSSGWRCTCPDFKNRHIKCKHVWGCEFSLRLREEVQAEAEARITRIEPVKVSSCRFCGSENIVRDGIRHNQSGDIQLYSCRDCNRYFSLNLGFEKMKASPKAITSAMQLYFTGESLRNVQNFLRLQGVNVSHVAVYKWIRKYVGLMEKYLDRITPKVSDTWRADEMYVKFKGNMKYVFALMDDETRFWLAHEVADQKQTHDARTLLKNGQEFAGKKPKIFITDGSQAYSEAYRKEWFEFRKPDSTYHLRHIRMDGQHNNNKMERMNGEIRDREKVMRGLKSPETPILAGYRIYHNYMRPHLALDGKTPAEASGISIEGENKWLTLIQNASRPTTVNSTSHPTKT